MPQSEKLKLKAEILTGEREVEDPQIADQKTLAKQIYEAYLKNFNMNKSKARTILTGKTSTPVRGGVDTVEPLCVCVHVFVCFDIMARKAYIPDRPKYEFALSPRVEIILTCLPNRDIIEESTLC